MNKNITIATIAWIVFSSYLATPVIAQETKVELTASSIILSDRHNLAINNFKDLAKDNVAKTLIILGLVSTVGFVGWRLSRQGNAPVANSRAKRQNNTKKALIDQVNPRLRRKLLRLVNDPKTANRLLMGIYKHNRDRSPNWLAEKAIYDLRRGR